MRLSTFISVFTLVALAATAPLFATGAAESATPDGVDQSTITVDHELGTARVPRSPARPVAFGYDSLDILDALDLPVGGIPKSVVPAYLDAYTGSEYLDAGTPFEANFEAIYDLQPQVIFISPRQADLYDDLSEIAPTVYFTVEPGAYMESVRTNVMTIAGLYGVEDLAGERLAALDERAEAIRERTAGQTALFLLVNDGSLSVYGPGSRFDVAYSTLGFEPADDSIEVATHGQNVSFEYLLEIDPDYLLVMDRGAAITGSGTARSTLDNPVVRQTTAYRNDSIIHLSAQAWYLASGGLTATRTMFDDVASALEID